VHHASPLKAYAESVEIVPFGRAGARVRTALALAAGRPLSVAWFPGARLAAAARRLADDRRPDVVFAFSSQAAPAAFTLGLPVVLDLVDRDSAKWAQYSARLKAPRGWIYGLEARRLAGAEEGWIERSAVSLVISGYEKSLFPPTLRPRIRVVANPVQLDSFPGDRSAEEPNLILFAGALDYFPNTDAVRYFARDVMPRVRARIPGAEFLVVGPRAPASVKALDGRNGTRVAGYVPDIRAVYGRAAVSVAPFRLTQGVLNKVVEAMASAIPVVATPEAVRGIGLEHGQGVWLGTNPTELAERTIDLLLDRDARRNLGAAGRRLVGERFRWPGDLEKLDGILEEARGGRNIEAAVG